METKMKPRDDLTIACPLLCDNDAKVFELYDAGNFMGYYIHCDVCDFGMELPQKYQGQLKSSI